MRRMWLMGSLTTPRDLDGMGFATMKRVARAAAWLLLAVIVILSVVPAQDRPVTGLPHDMEHFGIFVLTGVAFGLGYPPHFPAQAMGLVSFAGAVELAQLAVTGRHARLSDFIVNAISVLVGIGLSAAAVWGKESIRPHSADQ